MQFETKAQRRRAPGVIRSDESYTLREFLRRADVGDTAWREIRKKIRLRRVGGKVFVLGRDWLDYLASLESEPIEPEGMRRTRRNGAMVGAHRETV